MLGIKKECKRIRSVRWMYSVDGWHFVLYCLCVALYACIHTYIHTYVHTHTHSLSPWIHNCVVKTVEWGTSHKYGKFRNLRRTVPQKFYKNSIINNIYT